MNIKGREIGDGKPPYVVAEIGAGHAGSLESAMDLVRDAWRAGADAIKLQTYQPDAITVRGAPPLVLEDGAWAGQSLYELYEKAHTPREWHAPLFEEARKLGVAMFSSPFDPDDVTFLESLGCPAYKVASCEIGHLDLLEAIRETKKPVILSTGMADDIEIATAVEALYGRQVALLHCVSGYPTPLEQANLWRLGHLKARHPRRVIGYSDHTKGSHIGAILAIGHGAAVIEKHIGERESPDGAFAMEPIFFGDFVRSIRRAWDAMKKSEPFSETPTRKLRRSVRAKKGISAGDLLCRDNIAVARPAGGCDAHSFESVLGKTALVPFNAGDPVVEGSYS